MRDTGVESLKVREDITEIKTELQLIRKPYLMNEKSKDPNERWNDLLQEMSSKYGKPRDINKRWIDLMKEMSCKYNKNLMRGRLNKEAVNINLKEIDRVSDTVNHETIIQGKENIIKEPQIKLEESQTEHNKEKIKFYKSQITVLEERNKSYTLTTHFKDEVLRTQDEIHITEEDWEHPKRNKDKTPGVTVTNKSLDVSDKEKLKILNSNDQDNQDNRNDKQLNITENTEEVESQKKDNLLCIKLILSYKLLYSYIISLGVCNGSNCP
jgi:hypothetical protein